MPFSIQQHFNARTVKTKGLTLLIEHGPCCILSLAAGFVGLPWIAHNPMLELGFAMGGAIIGEYVGHRLFHTHSHAADSAARTARRYGLSVLFGLASWGVHQVAFHKPHDHRHETSHFKVAEVSKSVFKKNLDSDI